MTTFNVEERKSSYVAFYIAQMDLMTGAITPVMDEATQGVMLFRDTTPIDPNDLQSAYNRADAFIDRLPVGRAYQVQRVRVKPCPGVSSN